MRSVETHNHADHVAGHGRLALEHGARVSIHPLAEPEYDFDPWWTATCCTSETSRCACYTPGHRPEHCALLVDDKLLLTGDWLRRRAARPDLAVGAAKAPKGSSTACGASKSFRRRRGVPGPRRGWLCGASMSSDPSSTIGNERRSNVALRIDAVDDFVAEALSKNAPRPPNMDVIVALNEARS